MSEPHPHLIHTWMTCHIIGTLFCDAAGVSLKQRFQKNSLKFSCKLPSNYELKLPVSQIKKVAFEQSEKIYFPRSKHAIGFQAIFPINETVKLENLWQTFSL